MYEPNEPNDSRYSLDGLQRAALTLMAGLTLLSFAATNLQAILWQSSSWLVSTVLPAVVVDLTNEERAENAAPQLRRSATLDAAAQLKAEHMAANEYFSHYSPDGVSPWHWFQEAEYVYAHAGENLAVHFTDSSEVVEAWMDSPTHRANIVNSQFTEIGVGTAKGEFQGYDTVYVVQLFGTPGVTSAPEAVALVNEVDPEASAEPAEVVPDATPPTAPAAESNPDAYATTSPLEPPSAPATPTFAGAQASETTPTEPILLAPEPTRPSAPTATEPGANEVPMVVTSTRAETVVVTSPTISTSSGLAIAQMTKPNPPHAGATMASLITRPNTLLQLTYLALGTVVVFLLSFSIVFEARRHHFVQVAYGFALLFLMGGLWYVQSWLLGGALIA